MGAADCQGYKRGWEITILVALRESGMEKLSVIKQGQVFSLIKSLVGQANLLTIPRLFIDYTGDLESALLLSQIVYWSDKIERRDGFMYKTYSDWRTEIGLNEYSVRKAANHLKKMGILETEVHKANGNPTVHYRLIAERFSTSFLQYLQKQNLKKPRNENPNSEQTLTETTLPDITSESTEKDNASSQSARSSLVTEVIKKYYEVYRRVTHQEHPPLKENQLTRVKLELAKFADERCMDELKYFEDLIEGHFARTDSLKTDFNINHFATHGIMENLFYKHLL